MSRKNGGIIGPANTPVGGLFTGVAGGVWRMNDVANFVGNSQWPSAPQSIDNSCRFNSGSSDYLQRTPSSTGNRKTFTVSLWVKRSKLGSRQAIFNNTDGSGQNGIYFDFYSDDTLAILDYGSGSYLTPRFETTQVFRDVSAWYHIVYAVDTTQSTESDRVKIYVNGSQITAFDVSNYPSQNQDTLWNTTDTLEIGSYNGSGNYFSGYMAEVVNIDGQQLDPTSFGETDTATGIWKPKKIGAFASAGTNSFYLDFKDSSNLGNDASGLNNDFTVNNLTSIDESTDTCVENFATLNSLLHDRGGTNGGVMNLSDGNLTGESSDGAWKAAQATIAINSGKWYCEFKFRVTGSGSVYAGIWSIDDFVTSSSTIGDIANSVSYYLNTGQSSIAGSLASYGNSFSAGDILGIAIDLDNNKAYFSKNGTFQNSGDPTSGSTGTGALSIVADKTYAFGSSNNANSSSSSHSWNFGSPPYSISSGNADANGYGNFEYAVPSGYYALNTSNLNTYG